MSRVLSTLALLAFGAFTFYASRDYGYLSFFTLPFENPVTAQVFIDLCISATIVCFFLLGDVRRRGKSLAYAVPFILGAVVFGSLSFLVYFALRPAVKLERS